jgi:hypothetical protein
MMGDSEITKLSINQFVIGMREAGRSPATCDAYVRGFNVFLSWLFENGQIPEKLAIKRLKLEKRVMKTFSEAQLNKLSSSRMKAELFEVGCMPLLDCALR